MQEILQLDMAKIKELVYQRLWTWNELAKKANISTNTIYALQSHRRNASRRTAYKIAKALDISPCEIIQGGDSHEKHA